MNEPAQQQVFSGEEMLDGFQLTEFVPYLLNQAMSRLDLSLREALKPFNISIHQWRVMFMIHYQGPQSIGNISAGTIMGQSTITRVADQLEKAKLARRSSVEANQRVVLLSLTDNGRDLIEEVIPRTFGVHEGAIEGFDKAGQKQMFQMLQKLAANLRRHEAKQKFESV